MRGWAACVAGILAAGWSAWAGPPQVLYVGPDGVASQGLFRGRCEVSYARAGGRAYTVGTEAAPDVAEMGGKLPEFAVVFVDARVADTIGPPQIESLTKYVERGGNVVIEGTALCAKLDALSPLKPGATIFPAGTLAKPAAAGHPALLGVAVSAWDCGGVLQCAPAGGGKALIEAAGSSAPLAAARSMGRGKVVAVAWDHRAETFVPQRRIGYDSFLTLLALSLGRAGEELETLEGLAAAERFFIYGCFAAGYAKYRFGVTEGAAAKYDEAEGLLGKAREALAREDYKQAREQIASASRASLAAHAAAGEAYQSVTAAQADEASRRREILLVPGTLDVVHSMNCSQSALDAGGFWRPRSGADLLPPRPDLDMPEGASLNHWRGLHYYQFGQIDLPLRFLGQAAVQVGPDGAAAGDANRAIWIFPPVKALQAQCFQDLFNDALLNKVGGASWRSAAGGPWTDHSEFAQNAFQQFLRQKRIDPADLELDGWQNVSLPTEWSATPLYREFQDFRRQYALERSKTDYWAAKLRAPDAIVGTKPGDLNDPGKLGVPGAAAAATHDALFPDLLWGAEQDLSPLELEVGVRGAAAALDADKDGATDQWPGVLAKPAFSAPLDFPVDAHRLLGSVALLSGAQGLMHSWAADAAGEDATATQPEAVFRRWQASFEPAVRHNDLFCEATPLACEAAVWDSWASKAMSEGGPTPASPEAWTWDQPREWHRILTAAGYSVSVVYDEDLADEDAANFDVIVVPSVLCMDTLRRDAIVKLAQQGKVVIVGAGSGRYDDCHRPSPAAASLWGGDPGAATEEETPLELRPAREGEAFLGGTWRHDLPEGDGEVLAKDKAGAARVVARKTGEGHLVLCGVSANSTDRMAPRFWAGVLERCGGQRTALAQRKGKWEPDARVYALRTASDDYLVGVANAAPLNEQQALSGLEVLVRLPEGRYRARLLSAERPFVRNDPRGEALPTKREGPYLTFELSLEPYEARIIHLARGR